MRKIITGLFVLAVLLGVLAACGGTPSVPADPKSAAEAFLQGMANAIAVRDDPEKYKQACADIYKLLSADTQATITQEQFQTMLTTSWTGAGISGFQVKPEDVKDAIQSKSGSRASVPYKATLTTTQGATDVYNALSLVKENEQWLVVWPPAR
jgi:hypothetical protein